MSKKYYMGMFYTPLIPSLTSNIHIVYINVSQSRTVKAMTSEKNEKAEEKKDRKDNDLDRILKELCEPGCTISDEDVEFDFELEVIKREKAAETPQGWGRRSSYSRKIEEAVKRVEEYERSLREKKIMSKLAKLINTYNRVKERYKIPDLRELMAVDHIKRSMLDMIKTRRGSTKENTKEKAKYFKTIMRRVIIYSCVKGLFPVFTITMSGSEIISIRHILSDLEELSRSSKDRRVTNICVRGKSCLKRIFREVGAELSDDLLERIALTSARYSSIRFDLVMKILKISFVHDRDEMDVLNELLARQST
jgi:hypothetical protein